MLPLDFAFFNLLSNDKQGLVYHKYFLERLAPVLFSPRVQSLINLRNLDARGCNIILPLGQGNLSRLEPEQQQQMLTMSCDLLGDYNLSFMAVDRRLKLQFLELSNHFSLVFGDNFIKALASVLIEKIITERDVQKLIIIGDIRNLMDIIEEIAAYGLPVSMQSDEPTRDEVTAYNMMYKKGLAISTSYVKPEKWNNDDLVVVFDNNYSELAFSLPRAFYLHFTNERHNFAPEIEYNLIASGVENRLCSLAPILESCLWSKAGYNSDDEEVSKHTAHSYKLLKSIGHEIGLWQLFLDKPH